MRVAGIVEILMVWWRPVGSDGRDGGDRYRSSDRQTVRQIAPVGRCLVGWVGADRISMVDGRPAVLDTGLAVRWVRERPGWGQVVERVGRRPSAMG